MVEPLVLQASSTLSPHFQLIFRSTINTDLNMIDEVPMTPLRSNMEIDLDHKQVKNNKFILFYHPRKNLFGEPPLTSKKLF
jgi:hypothetical protein